MKKRLSHAGMVLLMLVLGNEFYTLMNAKDQILPLFSYVSGFIQTKISITQAVARPVFI
jgi:NADH pyrophosphatase NudC (nudix superfamily)